MGLREKLIHYTNDLGDVDLKQEAIETIEHIAQYMGEDELLHHSRPLALAYLALTEDASAPVRHGRWLCVDTDTEQFFLCNRCKKKEYWESDYCPSCGAKMGGGECE